MSWLIIPGVILTALGLGLLIYTIVGVWTAKRDGLTGDAMNAKLQSAVTWNMAAMGCSGLGLMMVALGVLL